VRTRAGATAAASLNGGDRRARLCSRERVLEAIEIAAQTGTTADRVLLERAAISPERGSGGARRALRID